MMRRVRHAVASLWASVMRRFGAAGYPGEFVCHVLRSFEQPEIWFSKVTARHRIRTCQLPHGQYIVRTFDAACDRTGTGEPLDEQPITLTERTMLAVAWDCRGKRLQVCSEADAGKLGLEDA